MPKLKNVLVQVTWATGFGVEMLTGIRDFAFAQPNWAVRYIFRDFVSRPSPVSGGWKPDIAIITWGTDQLPVEFPGYAGPVVALMDNIGADMSVVSDDREIGRLAARHLLECGCRSFGHVRYDLLTDNAHAKRFEGFREVLNARGLDCSVGPVAMYEAWDPKPTAAWIRSLARPAGIFCTSDTVAADLLALCKSGGIQVPEEVAIIGADNDPTICENCKPQLSTVAIGWRRVGQETARWAARLLRGQALPPDGRVVLPPLGVVARQSTSMLATPDANVARALGYLRENACKGVSLKQVLEVVPVGRRRLELAFRKYLGRSPHDEIRRIQVEHAKELLSRTDLTVDAVAQRSGLSRSRFIKVFHHVTGKTPLKYRESYRVREW